MGGNGMVLKIEKKAPAPAGNEPEQRAPTDSQEAAPADPMADALDNLASQSSSEQPEPAPKPVADNLEKDLFDMLKMAQSVARRGMWWLTGAEFDGLWGDPTLIGIAGPGAEIMRRNGWTMGEAMGKWGPYIALAAAAAPPAIATVQAYKAATVTPRPAPAPAAQEGATHGT